jgi:hypothetical protein
LATKLSKLSVSNPEKNLFQVPNQRVKKDPDPDPDQQN